MGAQSIEGDYFKDKEVTITIATALPYQLSANDSLDLHKPKYYGSDNLCLVSASVFAQDAVQLVTRAETAIESKDYDSALNELNQAIALQKKIAQAYAVRGDVYMAQKKVELARLDYNQALKLSPKVSTFYYKRRMSFKETLATVARRRWQILTTRSNSMPPMRTRCVSGDLFTS